METDRLIESNTQHLTNEQDVKTETPVESCGLHSDVCVKIEREISDKSYGLHTDVCVKTEQETSDESYGVHTDVCVKTELETNSENPVHVYVQQQHGDATAEPKTLLCIKNESEEQDLLHPQFCNGNDVKVKVKCEGKIKAGISSVARLKKLQREESCHVYRSDDGCKKEEDESDPVCPVDLGSQNTDTGVDTGQIVSYFNTAHKQEPSSPQEEAEPKIEIDVADTESVGDVDDDDRAMGRREVHTDSVCGDVSAKVEGTTCKSNQHGHAHACNVCSKTFPFRSGLLRHSRIHTREKPYKCGVCYKEFGYSQQLLTHMRAVHTGDKPHKCEVCCKEFGHNQHLLTHIRTVHEKDKPHKCTVCSKTFGEKGTLRSHMRTVHCGDKPYECSLCHKTFTRSFHVQTHIRTVHNKDRPHKCTTCFKAFGQSNGLQTHMRTIHGESKK